MGLAWGWHGASMGPHGARQNPKLHFRMGPAPPQTPQKNRPAAGALTGAAQYTLCGPCFEGRCLWPVNFLARPLAWAYSKWHGAPISSGLPRYVPWNICLPSTCSAKACSTRARTLFMRLLYASSKAVRGACMSVKGLKVGDHFIAACVRQVAVTKLVALRWVLIFCALPND
jgi:hypothetical protein